MTDLKTDLTITDLPSPAPESPVEALEWLGGTADEVAEGLRARGIRGKRLEARSCPLARYLETWWEEVTVWQNFSAWNNGEDDYHDGPTPEPCFEFAEKFDCGLYPDLLA